MSAFSSRPHSAYAAYARQSCPDCRSLQIHWLAARDLPWEVDPRDRIRVFELLAFSGQDADAWVCKTCANWGVFDDGAVVGPPL